jgi:uncharacterized protein DUF4838
MAKGGMPIRVSYSARAGKVLAFAARELARALHEMVGERVTPESSREIAPRRIQLEFGRATRVPARSLSGDSFAIARAGEAIALDGGSDRAALHAVYAMLEGLGARYAPGREPEFARIDPAMLRAVEPRTVEPAFARRAFVSDIMTWNYGFADRLDLHLAHDREFIPWMATRGLNAFFYIRHAHDTRLRIDELLGAYRERGIASEYGGHVIQQLLPRESFEANPEYFPIGEDGARAARGNLCVSSDAALAIVRDNALRYVRDYPENELLHVWGADVWEGAWCRCAQCGALSPQLQYMKVVNAIAEAMAGEGGGPPVAYLAYHDTIDPDPALKPHANVWFEWAPRERCYSHAVDDSGCETNPRYLESLKRYLELFDGRGHVFEYYQDAILFGGLGFATPSIIARDLRAYRAMGITSISSLTFGAHSVLAYPVNLDAFARGTRSPDFEPKAILADTAAERHPTCAPAMAAAYGAVARASAKVLSYADVMRPVMVPAKARTKAAELREATAALGEAIEAADRIVRETNEPLVRAESELWQYGREVLGAIADYLDARATSGAQRRTKGEDAIARIERAAEHVRAIDLGFKGTWGAYDFEWIRGLWLDGLRRGLEEDEPRKEAP